MNEPEWICVLWRHSDPGRIEGICGWVYNVVHIGYGAELASVENWMIHVLK